MFLVEWQWWWWWSLLISTSDAANCSHLHIFSDDRSCVKFDDSSWILPPQAVVTKPRIKSLLYDCHIVWQIEQKYRLMTAAVLWYELGNSNEWTKRKLRVLPTRSQCILTAVCTTNPVWMGYDCHHCCMAWLRQNLAENNIILLSIWTVSHNWKRTNKEI